nr:immunoglobulin light chain junction region [Macaca mulatta]NSL97304.1 immunoglobulin light chain junction region [Mus musculus]MOX86066.1 immunoglobulin light chain junction region [Macaca mulatta]MOX87587.1 immunoglobulin light chain junction region [Macaca mulatta]MOX87612.1 immunoglobulin light chain junction region [Macaca mulatta]
CQQGSSIPFTF